MNVGLAHKIYQSTLDNGGSSVNHKGEFLNGGETHVFIVSENNGRGKQVPLTEFTPQSILCFFWDNRDLLKQDGYLLGTWVEKGNVYLDVSFVVDNPWTAELTAIQNEQLSYFDLFNLTTVYVNNEQ